MPNWCWNSLEISGDQNSKEFKELKSKLFGEAKTVVIDEARLIEEKKAYLKKERDSKKALNNIEDYVYRQKMSVKDFAVMYLGYDKDLEGNVILKLDKGPLQRTLPMPEELLGTNAPSDKNEDFEKKYGASNWYDWRVKVWGTKWDVEFDNVDIQKDFIHVRFDSAWSPPCNWLAQVAEKYPTIHFKLEYEESGCAFKGVTEFHIKEGIASDDCWEWYGDCGECEKDYTQEGKCGCTGENGKPLVWGEEQE
jgi:hypothetical protein